MPIKAQNGVPVTAEWTPQATFQWPFLNGGATKIDAFVNHTDVVIQVREGDGLGWQDDQTEEILLRQGFNSREFPTPITGWRFKVWSDTLLATTGTVDMVGMA